MASAKKPHDPNKHLGPDSSDAVNIWIEGDENFTIRPIPPELREFNRRRRAFLDELLRKAEEYRKQQQTDPGSDQSKAS